MKKRLLKTLFLSNIIMVSISSYAASPASTDYVDRAIKAALTLPTYTVGQQALGGTVFYTNSKGTHGLVMANTDQGNADGWYNATTAVTNPTNYDSSGAVYTDWYLPSFTEMTILCLAVSSSVPALDAGDYWTATQARLEHAVVIPMGECPALHVLPPSPTTDTYAVRAIRSF